jgi:3-hydroxyisobutyrate dehydrogenase-like beta-hydroxyacid dehydrogenase
MKKVGIIGLGNMGLGMAQNILKAGFELTAYDVREQPLEEIARSGARVAHSPREVGELADVVFIMVLNGAQVKSVVAGENGLLQSLKPGATIICTATIQRSEIIEVAQMAAEKEIHVIDSPVSGGQPGAAQGTLTMMAAGPKGVFDDCQDVLNAVGKNIYHVGEEAGLGQTVKSALAALTGTTYGGIFEALVLGTKAGINPEVLCEVIGTSMVGSALFKDTAQHILERRFKGAGACIQTMYKDLGNTLSMAKECGVPMFTTSSAYHLFESGHALNPEEDNWTIIKLLENITGAKVKKTAT